MKYLQKVPLVLLCTLHPWRGFIGRQLRLGSFGKLRKLGGSGSPGQLLQQQQTKIVRRLAVGGAENQRKAKE